MGTGAGVQAMPVDARVLCKGCNGHGIAWDEAPRLLLHGLCIECWYRRAVVAGTVEGCAKCQELRRRLVRVRNLAICYMGAERGKRRVELYQGHLQEIEAVAEGEL